MIDRFSLNVAKWLNENGGQNKVSVDVMRYSLNVIFNTILIIIFSSLYATISKSIATTLEVMIAFAALRSISGGVHIKSSEMCILVSTSLIITLSVLSLYTINFINIFNVISIILLLIFAPSKIEEQTNIKKQYYPLLKIISIVMVGLNFYFQSSPIAISFLVQSLTLINFGEVKKS